MFSAPVLRSVDSLVWVGSDWRRLVPAQNGARGVRLSRSSRSPTKRLVLWLVTGCGLDSSRTRAGTDNNPLAMRRWAAVDSSRRNPSPGPIDGRSP